MHARDVEHYLHMLPCITNIYKSPRSCFWQLPVLISDNRVAGIGGNSTVVIAVSAHHDVALHSPTCPPAAELKYKVDILART